jgi:pimeloyl-ACP methyl ester carboxylesterase
MAGEPSQHFYSSERLRLAYWAWGNDSAPPLVLVHGRRTQGRAWDQIAESFRDRYYVVAPDLRGHGDSAWSTGSHYAPTEFMLDLVRLLELLGGRTAIVAHSFGAGVALFTAGVFPELVERLVAIETVNPRFGDNRGFSPAQMRDWAHETRLREARRERTFATLAEAAARLRETNARLTAPFSEHLARWGTRPVDSGFRWKFDPWLLTQNGLEVRADEITRYWGNITCPVLQIIGAESPLDRTTYQGQPVESYFRDARLVRVEGAGHWVQHDCLDATLALLHDFLAGYEG